MPRTRMDDEGPHPVDIHVGTKVKSRRLMLGLSQEELAKSIGLTFQQVQKYERGSNRISVSRLTDISRALKVPVDYFLEGCANVLMNGTGGARKPAMKGVSDTPQATLEPDPMTKRDVLELIRAYEQISTPQLKKQLLEMAKAMAKAGE
ncbi:MAG TPA: helix-turn-helix domain-containing protein [Alphaproteobacteria bacterium]|nr:transcriptional regulator [Rhodospirillaceae bacterium]HRJ66508.1 helix-turn-helix domain-containing protein [Alphaproteobacteria bacterium]